MANVAPYDPTTLAGMTRAAAPSGSAAAAFADCVASASGFRMAKPDDLKESMANTDQVAFAAFLRGVNPVELATKQAVSGSSAVSIGGQRVATLFFRSTARSRYHMFAQLMLEDGTVLAQFDRQPAAGMVQIGWPADIQIAVNGQPFASMSSAPSGDFVHVGAGENLAFQTRGCCSQPSCKYMCIGCLCFFPTLGIASCVAMGKMRSAPVLVGVSNHAGELPQLALRRDLANETNGDFEFGNLLDGAGKLDLLLLVCARVASGCCAPPPSGPDH